MAGERKAGQERPLGRPGARYRLALVVAGGAIGVGAYLATRSTAPALGIATFAAILVSTWGVLLGLYERAVRDRQRRFEGLRRTRDFAERLVIYDRETDFYADWYFRLRLQEELTRSERFGHTCALLLVEATQARLSPEREKQLFEAMASSFRETDLVAHMGNLRFVVLLPTIDVEGAALARARVLEGLAGDVEAGLAMFPADGKDWRELLTAAGASSADFYGSPAPVWTKDSPSRFVRRADGAA